MDKQIKEQAYYVSGMHCASCEVLIEKSILELDGVESIDASLAKERVLIEYSKERPTIEQLNKRFKGQNYIFSDKPIKAGEVMEKTSKREPLIIIGSAAILVAIFVIFNKIGLSGLFSVNSKSSLPMFFVFGILAGLSSCAALIGGLILSMSKQWADIYSKEEKTSEKLTPHFMFNFGRIVSYIFFGMLLGLIGSKLKISLSFGSFLIIGVSVMMFFLALQMLGVKAFRKFQIRMPKFVSRYVADESNFKGRHMPFIMGALTFFLPCGFTITAQGLALVSGNSLQGALIMLFFALGTAPILLAIGLSSVKLYARPHLANRFVKIAGILVLFFAVFNINSQLNILGIKSLSDIKSSFAKQTQNQSKESFAPIVNGKQLLKMDASSTGYNPKYFKIKAGIPVRWEITDKGTSGCTNAVISKGLFEGQIALTPGKVSVKEFTPTKAGKYKFSCWMGMISGIIEVVDKDSSSINSDTNADIVPISSGASGCGCGGGGGGQGSCH